MNKQEFLAALRRKLSGLPRKEREERLAFYGEMIDDKIEAGLSEAEAVASVGETEELLSCEGEEQPAARRRMGAWGIVLIALGSPIWISLLAAAFAVIAAVYAVLWSVLVSLWSVFASFAAGAPAGVIGGLLFCFTGSVSSGIFLIGCGFACAGLAIFSFFGCKAASKGTVWLTATIAEGIKKCFTRKGGAK